MANDEIHEQLAWLARGPANSILMYQGYEIIGYTFIQEPKITRAPIKIVVSVLMPLTLVAKRTHILVTLKRSGNSTMGR